LVQKIFTKRDETTLYQQIKQVIQKPAWPDTVEKKPVKSKLGIDYNTDWARKKPVRVLRAMLLDNAVRPISYLIAKPKIYGAEYLKDITGPVIFASNHASHLDTSLIISSLPLKFRHHISVAAASDYFFDTKLKAAVWSFAFASIPIERSKLNRRSSDLAIDLISSGWSLLIFPEGGRTPDGWGQEFKSGPAYLAQKTMAPIVPIYIHGTRQMLPKGSSQFSFGKVEIRFGKPIEPARLIGEHERQNSDSPALARDVSGIKTIARLLEEDVAKLYDETTHDWWHAQTNSPSNQIADFRGPKASSWRRNWELPKSSQKKQRSSSDDWLQSLPWWENQSSRSQINNLLNKIKQTKEKLQQK